MSRHDPARTAHTTDAGPKNGVTMAWSHDATGWFRGTAEPILSDSTLYAVGAGLLALDPETGARRFGQAGPYHSSPARASTTVYTSNTLAVTSTSGMVGLNSDGGLRLPFVGAVGTERWTVLSPPRRVFFSPSPTDRGTPVAVDGTVVTTTPGRESMVALDADNGEARWQFTPEINGDNLSLNHPAVHNGVVYTTAWPYQVSAHDLDSGAQQWQRELDEQMLMAPVATNGHLVVLSRESVRSLNPADGSTQWRYDHGGNVTESTPAVADGFVFVPTEGGSLHAVALANGERVWRTPFKGNGAPVVADHIVYAVRSRYELVALSADTGERRFTYEPEQVPLSTPIVADGRLYAVNRRQVLALEEA